MLRLSSRSAHRIGTSYICASCLAASHPTRLLALRPTSIPTYNHHGRLLSTTSCRAAPDTETSTPVTDGAGDISPPAQEAPKKKKNKKKAKKADGQPKPPPPLSKKDAIQVEGTRQLQVLQGALQALKNVLAAQNIDVDQISKSSSQSEPKSSKPKAKAKSKSHSSKKATKASDEEKNAARVTSKKESVEKKPSATAEDAVKEPVESSSAPAKIGRVRKGTSRKIPKRARSKGTASTKPTTKIRKGREVKSAEETPTLPESSAKRNTSPLQTLRDSLRDLRDGSSIGNLSYDNTGLPLDNYKVIGQPFTGESPPDEILSSMKNSSPLAINTLHANELFMLPIEKDHPPVPSLSYGLERVLFNPGVYYLQDPRSRVYNFDPYLSEIMPIQEFDFNALKQYVTSSKDSNLIRIAKEYDRKYTGSTSSMTSMLSHFHYLLSSWREINARMLSRSFTPDSFQFTRIMRGPAAVFLHWKDGTYAIDADKEYDTANILSMLGKSMEKLLTLSKEEYERYRHINSDQITEEERNAEEAFHYTAFGDFMMRSQLDAHDPRVPGSGMFDLKTRAVISIRMDARGFQKGLGYEIRNRFGQWESFEREYYDMIRSAFLKYSLQVRMGRMDGIFVAFHNTQRIFGFQYIPLSEMDLALHGTSNTLLGDKEYKMSLALLNDVLDRATKKFPEQSLRLHFETRTSKGAPFMYIFAKPVSQGDIEEVQSAGKASIEAFEKDMLGLVRDEAEPEPESVAENDDAVDEEEEIEESSAAQEISSLAAWKEARQMVEDAVDDDEVGVGAVREAIEDSLEQSGLLHAKSSTEARGYVDALLSAITGGKPSEPTELSLDTPVEEGLTVDEYQSSATQEHSAAELEPASDEQLGPDNELDNKQTQIQINKRPVETFAEIRDADDLPKIDEQARDNSVAPSEPVSEQDGEPLGNADPSESQATNADESVDIAALEQPPVAKSDSLPVIREIHPQGQTNVNTSKVTEEEEEEEEGDDVDDIDDECEAVESKKDSIATSTMSPLKDLIVKMARRIDEKTASDGAEDLFDDSSKLKEFERILGELIARSKDEQDHPRTDETSASPKTESESPTEDEVESIEDQLKESGDATRSSSEQSTGTASKKTKPAKEKGDPELFGMVLTIKNKVNGKYVTRPEELKKSDSWVVEYNIEEIAGKRAKTIYQQCRARRRKTFENTGDRDSQWYQMFRGDLRRRTDMGRKFRASETEKAKKRPVHVIGQKDALNWEDVFGRQQNSSETAEPMEDGVDDQ
ncbi:Pet127-domain-containing protein [Hypoxylon fuscum]|nr:Pet127-domain-containing protein [Hypoxylon fuscum]